MIEYKDAPRATDGIRVILDKKTVGHIRRDLLGQWRYWPKGGTPGDTFSTLAACKASLEAE